MRKLILLLLTSVSIQAKSEVLISVQDLSDQPTWGKEACELMHAAILSVADERVSCFLISPKTFSDERIRQVQSQNTFHTHLRIFRDKESQIQIDTHQWIRDDEMDFVDSSFLISAKTGEEQKRNLALFARNWASYRIARFHYKADTLMAAIQESKELKLNEKNQIVDSHTLDLVTYKQAYAIYASENDRQKNYLRTTLQISAALGFGTYLYYKNLASMRKDHDYKDFWDGTKNKLNGSAIREDDNNSFANLGHPFAGVVYHHIARSNGLSFIEASLATFTASAAWEFLEYKEVFSIPDQILTGWSGAVIGEVFYQISRALKNKSRTTLGKALATAFDPIGAFNRKVNSWMGQRSKDIEYGGLDLSQWAQFDFSLLMGKQSFQNAQSEDYKGIEMKGLVLNIADWDRPGKTRKLLFDSPVSEFQFTYTKSRLGAEDFKFLAEAVLAAVYAKDRTEEDGYEYLIGLSSGFDWDQKRSTPFMFEDSTEEHKDLMARTHVIGGTVKAVGLFKGIRFTLDLKVHADYVLVSSYALEQLEAAEGDREGLLSVVKKRGYYYGTGWSQDIEVAAEYRGWEVGLQYSQTRVKNSGFPHRAEEQVTKDYGYSDIRSISRFFTRKMMAKDWKFEVALVKITRAGNISNLYMKKTTEYRKEFRLTYIY